MAENGKARIFPAKEEAEKLAASGNYSMIPVYTWFFTGKRGRQQALGQVYFYRL